MEPSAEQDQGEKKVYEVSTFPVPFPLGEIKENITINTKTPSNPSKEQIINQAFKFHSEGNIQQAEKYYQYFIDRGFNDNRVFSNYGVILKNLGKLKEAELYTRKAIKLNPNYAKAYYDLAYILIDIGKVKEAEISLLKAIKINPNFADAYLNLGEIMRYISKLQEAELYTRKAIEINPNFADAYLNLGKILRYIGKLQEAELSVIKAIELNPDLAKAYYSLSLLKFSDENKIWKDKLFSESFLNKKSQKDQVNIYFARANILHKEKKYEDSSKCLKLANKLKLYLQPSNANLLINKSKVLLIQSDKEEINRKELRKYPESIFIVGMPRSGSTLLESILSLRNDVHDLGEINILEESLLECKKPKQEINLAELYWEKVNHKTELNITTNKWLYNYQYAGIIAGNIPNAKIIHCYRNPLDNILSIYRAHFEQGNEYSSSLVDCANVYLNQKEVMSKYKNRFRSKIYDLNYDSLVKNPDKEIKSLINWIGWDWQESYLSPHLNTRSVKTRSNVEVRSPINSKSIGGWKNYKDMLKPAIEILTQTNKYQDITS
ncbi:tetratricopeptide repeat protein [Prochlorococcus marinus]|uniref:tetratricopeptide repeat protein n=1 Tax=Prochlorococcus marinus TaxID=1219 RepID=UPI0022B4A7AE|nr:tetratricopeptide repeat protein [Prochlorococcus marinus]